MVAHALERVHADLELRWSRPTSAADGRRALAPALTTTSHRRCPRPDRRSRGLEASHHRPLPGSLGSSPARCAAGRFPGAAGSGATRWGVRRSWFRRRLRGASPVSACRTFWSGRRRPSLGSSFAPRRISARFVSFIAFEPDLVVYFDAPHFLGRCQERDATPATAGSSAADHCSKSRERWPTQPG